MIILCTYTIPRAQTQLCVGASGFTETWGHVVAADRFQISHPPEDSFNDVSELSFPSSEGRLLGYYQGCRFNSRLLQS